MANQGFWGQVTKNLPLGAQLGMQALQWKREDKIRAEEMEQREFEASLKIAASIGDKTGNYSMFNKLIKQRHPTLDLKIEEPTIPVGVREKTVEPIPVPTQRMDPLTGEVITGPPLKESGKPYTVKEIVRKKVSFDFKKKYDMLVNFAALTGQQPTIEHVEKLVFGISPGQETALENQVKLRMNFLGETAEEATRNALQKPLKVKTVSNAKITLPDGSSGVGTIFQIIDPATNKPIPELSWSVETAPVTFTIPGMTHPETGQPVTMVMKRGVSGPELLTMLPQWRDLPTKERAELHTASMAVGDISYLNNILQQEPVITEHMGPVSGRMTELRLGLGGIGLPPSVIQLSATLARMKNMTIKAITGAQMSEREVPRLEKQIPMWKDSPAIFQSKIDDLLRYNQRSMRLWAHQLRKRGFGTIAKSIEDDLGYGRATKEDLKYFAIDRALGNPNLDRIDQRLEEEGIIK